MKIFSPHRRRAEAKKRFGGKEFQSKIKKAQGYKRVSDPRSRGVFGSILHALWLDSIWVQIVALLLVGSLVYFFGVSDYFQVREVAVAGTQRLTSEQLHDAVTDSLSGRWAFVPKNHFLLLSKSRMEKALVEALPLVRGIKSFKRTWPNRLEVEIEERRPGFAFNVDGRNYLVDEEGLVVRELETNDGLVQVIDQVSEPIVPGERFNNTKLVGFILSASRTWPGKVNTGVREVKVPGKAATQVQFVSQEGWGVFLDINRPAESQLASLALILNRQIPAQNRLKLAYIDLRFDQWAYYCYKDAPCESQPQPDPALEGQEGAEGETEEEAGTGVEKVPVE